MKELIDKDLPINKIKVTKEEAINIFKSYNMNDKVLLLEQVDFKTVNLYELDGRYDYFYGHMTKRTSDIKAFDLIYYQFFRYMFEILLLLSLMMGNLCYEF